MNRAIFLDRDGVLNETINNGYVKHPDLFKLIPTTIQALKKLNNTDFKKFVITNQSVVGRGLITEKTLNQIHKKLENELKKHNISLDKIYYCPHHPEAINKYKIKCSCRKPNTGMIKQAEREFNLDLKNSFLIGDQTIDILTGKRANVKTILVKTGYGGADNLHNIKPDFIVKDINKAVDLILRWKG